MQNSAWIKDGLLVTKGKRIFFFQNLSFGTPLREQRVPRTRVAKTKQGEFPGFFGGKILIAY